MAKAMEDGNLNIQESVESYQRVRVDIDLDAAVENMKNMKANLKPETKMLAVVKTDGYGHGAPDRKSTRLNSSHQV